MAAVEAKAATLRAAFLKEAYPAFLGTSSFSTLLEQLDKDYPYVRATGPFY